MQNNEPEGDDVLFAEFRRKVRCAEVLSSSLEKLLARTHFTGRITVVVQNGRILKSGYEEGYFTRRQEERMIS
jgi:hypothetical protein